MPDSHSRREEFNPVKAHQQAVEHLSGACEIMAQLVGRFSPEPLEPKHPEEFFAVLVRTVVGQQLSVKAAATINGRLHALASEMTPEVFITVPLARMREAGLSQAKAISVSFMSEAFVQGSISPHDLATMSDAEVIATLTTLKGVGPWTAEMFLIEALARPDVWSPGDLGLRRAITELFDEPVEIDSVVERWQPYRSYASMYLWEHADAPPLRLRREG